MTQITPQPGIMDITLYKAGDSRIDGVDEVLKLSSNENPFGPSPKAQEAIIASAARMHRYPSVDHSSLRTAISNVFSLDTDRIICGVGSDEIIHLLCQCYIGQGDEVLYTEHGFSMYRISAMAAGGTPVVAPEIDRQVDVDAVLDAVTDRTRLVFITNPGNPSATFIDTDELSRLAAHLPETCLLILDGAYAEFADGYDGGAALVEASDNVVMTRTFSKLYGLGGLRVGWAYAPRTVVDVLNRVRGPFNLSVTALAAAEAAVNDQAFVDHCLTENARLREWMIAELAEMGIPADRSYANFILARFASPDDAKACDSVLKSKGIIVRSVGGYGLPNCLRITVGDTDGCARVIAAIREFRAETTE
jgi:histidinol-phosphate aminotransferase